MKRMGEVWKTLSEEEIAEYKQKAEESKKEAFKEWENNDAVREEVTNMSP